LIFNILPDEFLEPGQGLFVPALWVEVEHGVVWEVSRFEDMSPAGRQTGLPLFSR